MDRREVSGGAAMHSQPRLGTIGGANRGRDEPGKTAKLSYRDGSR
jgi:hypothetical protein